jgi:hypothetical protein
MCKNRPAREGCDGSGHNSHFRQVFKILGVIVVGLCLARLGLYSWSSGILLPVYSLQMYLPESD